MSENSQIQTDICRDCEQEVPVSELTRTASGSTVCFNKRDCADRLVDAPSEGFWWDPESHCHRCSIEGYNCVHHGKGGICDRDPEYVVNVIAKHFADQQTGYVGIVWEAIANGALTALGWHRGETVTIDGMGRVNRG